MLKKIGTILKNNNSYALFGNMIVALAYLLCMVILTRYFSTDIFGQWTIYFTTILFIDSIRHGLVQTPLVKFYANSKDSRQKEEITGSGWVLLLIITGIFIVLTFAAYLLLKNSEVSRGFIILFKWYPLYSLSSIPINYAMFVVHSQENFKKLFLFRFFYWGLFVCLIIYNCLVLKHGFETIVLLHTITNIITSVCVSAAGSAKIKTISRFTFKCVKKIFHFGKYSIGTLICSNLLKSADIFLIGLFMTNSDIAFYSIPMKMIESIDVPILSFAMVALPILSKESLKPDKSKLNTIFYRYTFFTLFLLIPVLIIMFIFSKELVLLFGGHKYVENILSINIFRIFILYGLVTIVDKFTGVVLDSINRPKTNFTKVVFMNVVNIIGDIIVLVFFRSLEAVAVMTLCNVIFGAFYGIIKLKQIIGISLIEARESCCRDIKFFWKNFVIKTKTSV